MVTILPVEDPHVCSVELPWTKGVGTRHKVGTIAICTCSKAYVSDGYYSGWRKISRWAWWDRKVRARLQDYQEGPRRPSDEWPPREDPGPI